VPNSTITGETRSKEAVIPPELVVVSSADPGFPQGSTVSLKGKTVIGRVPGPGGIVIDDPAVSREHVHIEWHARQGLAELTDLDSKNGTFINGFVTSGRHLKENDVVRIGDTLLVVRVGGGLTHQPNSVPYMIGSSPAIEDLRAQLALAADTALPVLLLGETGTGRDLAARALHELSGRTGGFEAIDCSAVADGLFESTFFGHEKGSFSGAAEDSAGLLAACHQGTLFLDEIGELLPASQPKLLRFMEDGVVRPVGGAQQREVDVRILAATSVPLQALAADAGFESDLLARLQGVVLRLPPLRERREDILPLMQHFARQERGAEGCGGGNVNIEHDALEALLIAPWRHNVRELRAVVQYWAQIVWPGAAATCRAAHVALFDLAEELRMPIENRQRAPE